MKNQSDVSATIASLRKEVKQFVEGRKWQSYHKPKDLAIAIATEAAELLELFLWRDELRPKDVSAVRREMADILIYLLSLSNTLSIDLAGSVIEKIKVNAVKYPVGASRRW